MAVLWPRSSVAERPVALLFGYRRLAKHSALLMIVYSGVTGVTSPPSSSPPSSGFGSGSGSGFGSSPDALPLLIAGMIYLFVTTVLSWAVRRMERRLKASD